MKCETCLNSRTGISENGYHCVCTLSAKKSANCITNDYKHYVKSPLDIPQKPITNADRIRGMSNEELAEFMANKIDCQYCSVRSAWCTESEASCKTNWLDWLRQEARE